MANTDEQPTVDEQTTVDPQATQLRNVVSIHVLEDGQVVFGDLPPELAEVAALLAGDAHRQDEAAADKTARSLAKTAESGVS